MEATTGHIKDLPKSELAVDIEKNFEPKYLAVEKKADLIKAIVGMKSSDGPQMLIVKVNKGARKDLGRPTSTPIENKEAFMKKLE